MEIVNFIENHWKLISFFVTKTGFLIMFAFMNNTTKTGIIICNDDTGFITKEEFDTIDWRVA